jgi:propanol-preferring alcohol dehydrogenase
MKAVRIAVLGAPLKDAVIPRPEPGHGEVLVRVRAAGICRSDVHYRAGTSPVGRLPITPGHEVSGIVEAVGLQVTGWEPGDRVCLHYLLTCGACEYCLRGTEQFCQSGRMMGKHVDGGYAEYVCVPARCVVALPADIPFEHGAVIMCSSATSFHALRKARLCVGERVAILGAGGLGLSAIQIARAMGAAEVFAVDVNPDRLRTAAALGGTAVDARDRDPVAAIRELTGGAGVDVSVELLGSPQTMRQALGMLAPFGRAAVVGITDRPVEVDTYRELIGREAEMIGVSDHLRTELPVLLDMVRRGVLDLRPIVTRTVGLSAAVIDGVMDDLVSHRGAGRTVIAPS